jgi:hypothetical protein
MPKDNNDLPDDLDNTFDSEVEELRQQVASIYKKLNGDNLEPVTHNEILQFLRVINYNSVSLAVIIQSILLKTAAIDITLSKLELATIHMDKRLQQFFDTNSILLDEITKGDFDVSGSASGAKFIF